MIDKLKLLVEDFININQHNPQELKKYQLIKKILNEKNCFQKISIEYAYAILRDLQIPEKDLKSVYMRLI